MRKSKKVAIILLSLGTVATLGTVLYGKIKKHCHKENLNNCLDNNSNDDLAHEATNEVTVNLNSEASDDITHSSFDV